MGDDVRVPGPLPQAAVIIAGQRYELAGRPVRFGRATHGDVVGLDADDTGISRAAGRVEAVGGHMTLRNESTKRPLVVEHPTRVRHVPVPPLRSYTWAGPARVLVAGNRFTHPVDVEHEGDADAGVAESAPGGTPTADVALTAAERVAVVAVAAPYLARWPLHDENPLPYDDAATVAGLDATTLRRRVEHLRDRLNARGVVDATGPHALRILVDYLIDAGVVGVADAMDTGQAER